MTEESIRRSILGDVPMYQVLLSDTEIELGLLRYAKMMRAKLMRPVVRKVLSRQRTKSVSSSESSTVESFTI